MKTALCTSEQRQLARLEERIEANLSMGTQHYRLAAADLAEVKALSLYRAHGTWEGYCETRWGISRSRAYQLLTYDRVSTVVDNPVDLNERHARVMAGHPPEVQQAAWDAATANGSVPTATEVEAMIDAIVGEESAAINAAQRRQGAPATRSTAEVAMTILRHLRTIGRLLEQLPDVGERAERAIARLKAMILATTEC